MADAENPHRWDIARTTAGLLLLLTFVATFSEVTFTIAGLQFKDTILNSSVTPKPTLGSVRKGVSALEGYYATSNDLNEQQNKLQDAIKTQNDNLPMIAADLDAMYADVTDLIKTREAELPYPALAAIDFNARKGPSYYYTLQSDFINYINAVKQAAAAQPSMDPVKTEAYLDETVRLVREKLAKYPALLSRYTLQVSTLSRLERQLDDTRAKYGTLDRTYLTEATHLNSEGFRNLCEELLAYKALLGSVAYTMIFAPKSSLVLGLAVVMGVLGSIIYLTRILVIEEGEIGYGEIAFRALLGGAVALAIYVFAAAGLVALGQTPGAANNSDLSPYFISFLGITAGYLSEHMTQWMAQLGRKTFKIDDGPQPQRWALFLKAQLAQQNLQAGALAEAIGVDKTALDDWIAVKAPVPAQYQQIVAAFLRIHPSLLYTDIEPTAAATAPAAN